MTTHTSTLENQEWREEQVVDMLIGYYQLGQEIRGMEDARARAGAVIREYLDKHGGLLVDGERGITAYLQGREGMARWDLTRVPDALLLWAAKMGLLTVDNRQFVGLLGKFVEADNLKPYRQPGAPSTALVVEKEQ